MVLYVASGLNKSETPGLRPEDLSFPRQMKCSKWGYPTSSWGSRTTRFLPLLDSHETTISSGLESLFDNFWKLKMKWKLGKILNCPGQGTNDLSEKRSNRDKRNFRKRQKVKQTSTSQKSKSHKLKKKSRNEILREHNWETKTDWAQNAWNYQMYP